MNNLKTALENVMRRDIERYENTPEHEFSAEFERKMSALSKRVSGGKRPKRMRIVKVFAAAAAAVALFAMGTLAGAVSSGFNIAKIPYWRRNGKPANIFTAVDTENCPKTIETVYTLSGFPDELTYMFVNEKNITFRYYPAPAEEKWADELYFVKTICLEQYTKENFEFTYTDMDYITYKPLTLNGRQAYYIEEEHSYGIESYLFWETEDYIFRIASGFGEERSIELANSLEVYDGEIGHTGVKEE